MNEGDKIVHGLWIGSTLSAIEQLTINSFIKNGHTFILWTYEDVKNVPKSAIVKDASEIISKEAVFKYKYSNQFGHGKGSYAGFSDLFRYKLLYEKGGWWVDMDVTCLKALSFETEYVFRWHHKNGLVGNIMKCPAKSELMLFCYNEALTKVTAENTDWMLPLKILKTGIEQFDLTKFIKDISNKDSWPEVAKLLKLDIEAGNDWYAIHWMNEEWRRLNLPKDKFLKNSYINKLMTEFDIDASTIKPSRTLNYHYKIGKINYSLVNLPFQIKGAFSRLFS